MKRVAIIGAGIAGLFIANLFKKNSDYQITIFERESSINLQDSYGIQLSVNSVNLLNKIGFNELNEKEKFNPDKIDFYSNKDLKKICELNISDFNESHCKYTTLKRSVLIDFLKKDLKDCLEFNYCISKIDTEKKEIKVSFENNKSIRCDYLIISDGVFSKGKNLVLNNQFKARFNDSLAIRGTMSKTPSNINYKNISLFLGSNYHHVIYPVNSRGDFNFIAIMKYKLSIEEQKNYFLFNEDSFIKKVLNKVPIKNQEIFNDLKNLKIFPVFTSNNFCQTPNNNIQFIGDAFFETIENNTERNFFINRVKKTKMVSNRSKLNQLIFHLSNPIVVFFRNFILKKLVKDKKFLKNYLGKIYEN